MQECLDLCTILSLDTENQGAIVALCALGQTRGLPFLFQKFKEGIPARIKKTFKIRKPTLICNRTEDWKLRTETLRDWIVFDPVAFLSGLWKN